MFGFSYATLPIRHPAKILPLNGLTCPPVNNSDQVEAVKQTLLDYYCPSTSQGPPCSCGRAGDWTRVAHLNMSDPNQQCPTNWRLVTSPVRGCGRKSSAVQTCDSATYKVGRKYSNVCGRVNSIQRGLGSAFNSYIMYETGIESSYISGVSLTHGAPGSRKHIWSFVTAYNEQDPKPNYRYDLGCPCTNTEYTWPYSIPPFVNNNYFCDTGNPGPGINYNKYYSDNPLWDGQGCGSTDTCCELNSPPWFCTTLPEPAEDDLELRNCYPDVPSYQDNIITLIDIYVR